jgi:8-oxo-dGTP diphosphatase
MGESKHGYNELLNISIAAVIKNNKILMIKRVKPPYKDFWGMPGGKIDFGEHPEQAALREIKEETNLDCEFEGFKGIASEIVHNNGNKVAHLLLYVCRLKPVHSNVEKTKEGNLKWFDLDEIQSKEIIPSDIEMIKEFILKDNKTNIHKIKMIEDNGKYTVEEFKE